MEKVRDVLLSEDNLTHLAQEVNQELLQDEGRISEEKKVVQGQLRTVKAQAARLRRTRRISWTSMVCR